MGTQGLGPPGNRVQQLKSSLFGLQKYVCGGHGARWPADTQFNVPAGVKIFFYVPDGDSLGNLDGQKVDQILNGGTAPTPTETIASGSPCWDYRLFSSKAGGYLNLKMSSGANQRYITCSDKDQGIKLTAIIKNITAQCSNFELHWSACRAIESGTDVFSWDKPTYSKFLLGLGGKKGP